MIDKPGQPRLRLTLRQLEVFVAVAREGSTRAAAARVARSQSAASSGISELELALGCVLFDRVGRRLVLNENGRALYPRAVALVEQTSELEVEFGTVRAGALRVAASMTIGEHLLPPLVAQWKFAHPESAVRLLVDNTAGVLQSLADFDADLGFIEGQQTHADLVVHHWVDDELVIVGSPDHVLAGRRARAADLRSAQWALREVGSGTREAAERWLMDKLGRVDVAFELGTPEAIKRVVETGAALGFLPRHAVTSSLRHGELVEIQTGLPSALRRLGVVWHRDKPLGAAAQAFMRYCFEAVGARPPEH